jgi:hypothetical protein
MAFEPYLVESPLGVGIEIGGARYAVPVVADPLTGPPWPTTDRPPEPGS